MSFKSSLEKIAINVTPKIIRLGAKLVPKVLVVWIANMVFKGIAEFSDIIYDLNARTAFVKVTLYGEEEAIEVSVDGFAIVSKEDSYQFVVNKAESNKPWMRNILARVTAQAWDIPEIPNKFRVQFEIVANLLKAESAEEESAK